MSVEYVVGPPNLQIREFRCTCKEQVRVIPLLGGVARSDGVVGITEYFPILGVEGPRRGNKVEGIER